MAKKSTWFKRLSWRLEFLGYRLMEILLRPLSAAAVDRLGSAAGSCLFSLSPHYRRLVIRNLRLAFGGNQSLPEIHALARETCRRNLANFLGALKTTLSTSEQAASQVTVEGQEALHHALAENRGAILVLGHMGNWEILNRLHQFLPPNTPAGGIYQPLGNPLVDALLLRRRQQDGSRLFSKRDGFHGPATFVKNGGVLIVVADQKVGHGGTAVPFFNRLSAITPLPAILARKADSPVFAVGLETSAPGQWRLVLQALGTRPETPTIIAALESLIRRSPADYLWLHDRWKLNRQRPFLLNAKRKPHSPLLSTVPFRFLLLAPIPASRETLASLESFSNTHLERALPLTLEPLFWDSSETPESLAHQIHALDLAQPSPFVGILLDQPCPLAKRAAELSKIPLRSLNSPALPLPEFLQSLL